MGFANFYKKVIKKFSIIAVLLTLILQKTPGFTTAIPRRFNHDHDNKIDNGSRVVCKNTETCGKCIGAIFTKNSRNIDSLQALAAFISLQTIFTKALNFYHFDPERHIHFEIHIFDFAIGKLLSELLLSNDYTTHDNNPLYPNLSSKNSL